MDCDWIEPESLPVVRTIAALIDRRRYDVVIEQGRVVVAERPSGARRAFYMVHQFAEFCLSLDPPVRGWAARWRSAETPLPWRANWLPRAEATADELKNEVARLHETITILRGKRRLAEAERDRWERLARDGEAELSLLRGGGFAGNGGFAGIDKFRRAKRAVARLTHPDSTAAAGIEATIREKLFKEFWAEFERIEAES